MVTTPRDQRRLLVVGLDGVPIGLLRQLTESGVMPRVRELIGAGHLIPMRASLPEISSVSWTSFMTGTQPGEHGVFGFTDIDPRSYALTFPTFPQVHVPTLWDRLGHEGMRSLVINQPATYPARAIPGTLISGFVSIDLRRSVQPLAHLAALRRLDYRVDIDTLACRHDHDRLFRELDQTLQLRKRAVETLWDDPWNLLQVVVTGTDRLYHFLWDALEDSLHPRHHQALDYHRRVDAFVGWLFDRFGAVQSAPHERFWMLSDHGFCGIHAEVQLNAWLRSEGLLAVGQEGARDLGGIAPASVAFALDPGRIYVHRAGRFARGGVSPQAVAGVKRDIAKRLRGLRYHDAPVVREVFDASEIYRGPCAAQGPDLVVLSHHGFDLKASPATTEIFGRTDLVGMHTWDDAFLLSPRRIEEPELWIGDVSRHLLEALRE